MEALAFFLSALVVTLVLEGLVFLPLLLRGDRYFTASFLLINLITNATLNFIVCLADLQAVRVVIFVGEILAVAIEYLVLRTVCKNKYLFWFTLAANAVSGVLGSLLLSMFLR